MAILDYKTYSHLTPLYDRPSLNEEQYISSSHSLEKVKSIWEQYMDDETIRRYQYEERKNGKKYEHRFGYRLEILIPEGLTKQEKIEVSHFFMKELLKGVKKVSWVCEYIQIKNGHYLNFSILLAKKYNKMIEVKEYYNSDVYRNKYTGGFINKDHQDAKLVANKGDVKKVFNTHWSIKIRLFEMSKNDFINEFIPRIQNIIIKALRQVRKVREVAFLKGIKHVTLDDPKKSVYYNKNIRYFNTMVDELNLELLRWEDAIYSPAKYCHDSETLKQWNHLKGRFKSFTKKKRFKIGTSSSKTYKLSLHPWISCDKYSDNIDSFKNLFYKDLDVFLKKHIYNE